MKANLCLRTIIMSDYRLDYQYKNNIDTIYFEKYDGIEKGNFPGIIAMGVSYRIGDYLTIACDYDMRPFKNKVYSWDYTYYKVRDYNSNRYYGLTEPTTKFTI